MLELNLCLEVFNKVFIMAHLVLPLFLGIHGNSDHLTKKYYEREELIQFTGDALEDYDILMDVILEDLQSVEVK